MGKIFIETANHEFKYDFHDEDENILLSSDIFRSLQSAIKGATSTLRNAPIAPVEDQTIAGYGLQINPKYELFADAVSGFRFLLKAKNGQVLATSGTYMIKEDALAAIAAIRKQASTTSIEIIRHFKRNRKKRVTTEQ